MERKFHLPAPLLRTKEWSLEVTQQAAGWSWSSLRVMELLPGETKEFNTGDEEMLALPLEGSFQLEASGTRLNLVGRTSPFHGTSDFVYAPPETKVTVHSDEGGRLSLPGARAEKKLELRYLPSSQANVEIRGAGPCSRKVTNYCMPKTLEADRLMVCEVLTPGGNWSSYPPHKHDRSGENESELEEIYYFEIDEPNGQRGLGYQRVYGSDEREIDVMAPIGKGDVVLVPYGWHGPSMAAPGYDMYYLNVMAGPGERQWLACDDPRHAWVRDTWAEQEIDVRLQPSNEVRSAR